MEGLAISALVRRLLARNHHYQYPLALIILLIAAFLLDNLLFGPLLGGLWGNYIYPSLYWIVLAIIVLRFPRLHPAAKMRFYPLLSYLALICILIFIFFQIIQGFMGGFGKSPYSHSILGILINIFSLGTALLGMELSRAWLINRFAHKRPLLTISFISLTFLLFSFPISKFTSLQSAATITKFMGVDFIPTLGEHFLASYLAFLGGPLPAVIYRGGIIAFEYLSPILPAANWISQTLLGTLAPVLGLLIVRQAYLQESRQIKAGSHEDSQTGWLLTSLASVIIIWFCLGVFSYSPRVIVSGSMVPTMNIGDIVIVKEIVADEAQLGDIIMFSMGNMKVTHRVVDIKDKEGKRTFITQGDAYDSPDADPVKAEEVKGKVVKVIPKLGCLTILMRDKGSGILSIND